MDKKKITILRKLFLLNWPYDIHAFILQIIIYTLVGVTKRFNWSVGWISPLLWPVKASMTLYPRVSVIDTESACNDIGVPLPNVAVFKRTTAKLPSGTIGFTQISNLLNWKRYRKIYSLQHSPSTTLCLGSIGIDHVISRSCYKGTILQRNYRKMTIVWSFSYNSFVNFHGKKKIW